MNRTEMEPLLVSQPVGKRVIGVGNTKWYELIKAGKITVVEVGGRQMAVYASLKRLAAPEAAE